MNQIAEVEAFSARANTANSTYLGNRTCVLVPLFDTGSEELNSLITNSVAQDGSSLRLIGGHRTFQEAILLALCKSMAKRGGTCVFLDIDLALAQSPLAESISLYSERLTPQTTAELDVALRDLICRAVPPKLVVVSSLTTALLNDIYFTSDGESDSDISKREAYLASRRAKILLREVVPLCQSKGVTLLWTHQGKDDFTFAKHSEQSKVGLLSYEVGRLLLFHCDFGIHIVPAFAPKVARDRVEIQVSGATNGCRHDVQARSGDQSDCRARYRDVRIRGEHRGNTKLTLHRQGGFFYPSVVRRYDESSLETSLAFCTKTT